MYSPELDPKKRLEDDAARQMEARQEREDFAELPSCANPWKRRRVCDSGVRTERNTRKTNFVILCVLIVLSVIPVLLGRYWVEDEFSFVFKNKVTGRVVRVERKEKVSTTRRRGSYRIRRHIEEIEHYVYNVDGRRYRGTSTKRWNKAEDGEQPRVPVYYDSDKPSESRLMTVWWVFIKLAIVGVLMWFLFLSCMTTVSELITGRVIDIGDGKLMVKLSVAALVLVVAVLAV